MANNAKVWAPAATFVAVLGVGGAAVLLTGGDSGPRPLRLADAAGAKDAAALGAPVAAGGKASSGYTLVGELPQGRPDDAPAWDLPTGAGPAAPVARLAQALGEGMPERDGSGWRAGGLFVNGEAGRSWWWSPCGGAVAKGAPDTTVSSSTPRSNTAYSSSIACAVDSPLPVDGIGSSGSSGSGTITPDTATDAPVAAQAAAGPAVAVLPQACSFPATHPDGTPLTAEELRAAEAGCPSNGTSVQPLPPVPAASPAPAPPTPSEEAVAKAAAPVLEAVGLDVDDAVLSTYPGGGSATVRRVVDEQDVVGLLTVVTVDGDAHVQGASGSLGDAERGDDYPLISAQEAFDDLPAMPRVLSCAVTPDGGCKDPGPAEVTGAHLGLTVAQLREGGQVLVPAWLFDVKGSVDPVPAVAVQPQYLLQDDPATEPATGKPVPPPNTVDPAPPARAPLSFDSAFRGEDPATVVVQYGDSSSCPHTGVTSGAKEDATTVYVFLEADTMPGDMACTDDYRGMKVTVDLQAPLGDRKVVDATTGREIALS